MDEFALQAGNAVFGDAVGGEIPDKSREQTPAITRDFANSQFHWEQRAVFFARCDLASDPDDIFFARCSILDEKAIMFISVRGGHECRDIIADDLNSLKAKHTFGSRAKRANNAMFIDDDQAIGGCFDNQLEKFFFFEVKSLVFLVIACCDGGCPLFVVNYAQV